MLNRNYFHLSASPSHILFDRSSNSLKRSHIGPVNLYKNEKVFSKTTPSSSELMKELRRIVKQRAETESSSQLKGKHELTSKLDRPKTTQHSSSPFLLVGSPLYKSLMERRKLAESKGGMQNTLGTRIIMINKESK